MGEESTATKYPSWMSGAMELPRTRKQLVYAGLGHQSFGAAIMPSIGASLSSERLSPLSLLEAVATFNIGTATS